MRKAVSAIISIKFILLNSQVWANPRFDDKCKNKLAPVVTALAVADGWDPKEVPSTGAQLDFYGKMQTNGKIALYSARFTYSNGYSNYSDYSLEVEEQYCDLISVRVNRL